jgi:hypothetical protein
MSWYQLIDILQINSDEITQHEAQPPESCPYGGFPLEQGPDGTLHCPEGDFFWPDSLIR